jgi:hypothetical protein
VTSNTLSRSAKGTRKTVARQASNGTPVIDENSATISVASPPEPQDEVTTGWTLQFSNGGVHHVRVKGGRGRISFSGSRSGGAGEVRIYRNESTKTFDAAFSGVVHVVSDKCEVIPVRDSTNPTMHGGTDDPVFNRPARKPAPPKKNTKNWATSASTFAGGWAISAEEKPMPLNPEDFEPDNS